MAVSNLKLQFERLSTTGDNESNAPSTNPNSTPERPRKNIRQEPRQDAKVSPGLIPKKQLRQIGKVINSPSENRKSNIEAKKGAGLTTKTKSMEESSDRLKPDAATVSALADVFKSRATASSSSPSSSTTSSPLTQSMESRETPIEETSPGGTPLRARSSSAKDRESKGRSAPLPMIVSKQSESSSTSSPRVKPKLAPKPASVYKSNENMTKPTIAPKPKILPKPAVAKKPPVIPVTSPEPSLFKSTENSDSVSPVRQSSNPENTSTVIPTDDVKRNLEESSDSTPIVIVNSSEKDFSSSGEQQVISTSPPGPLPPVFISDDDDTLMHVQSAATSTTTDEVVGANTKRGAVDSGYQEGMEEIREKWNTAKVCMYKLNVLYYICPCTSCAYS